MHFERKYTNLYKKKLTLLGNQWEEGGVSFILQSKSVR